MKQQRARRVAEQLQQELADLLRTGVKDPRVGMVTVTQVEVSADVAHAKVYFTTLAGREHSVDAVAALSRTAGFLRSQLSQIYRVTGYGSPRDTLYRLVGPICQPGDVIYPCVRLPRLSPGDTLMIMDSGAYFEPDSTSFSFQRPGTVAIDGEQVQTIRRAESFQDMIHRDHY